MCQEGTVVVCTLLLRIASGTNKGEGREVLQIRNQLVGKYKLSSSHSVGSEDGGVLFGDY